MHPVILALTFTTLFISVTAQSVDSDSKETVYTSEDAQSGVHETLNTTKTTDDDNSHASYSAGGGTLLLLLLVGVAIYYWHRNKDNTANFTQFNNYEDGSAEQNQPNPRKRRYWGKRWRRNRNRSPNVQPPTQVIIQNVVQVVPETSNPSADVTTYVYPDASMPPPNIHKGPPPNSYNMTRYPPPPPAYDGGMSVEELERRVMNI